MTHKLNFLQLTNFLWNPLDKNIYMLFSFNILMKEFHFNPILIIFYEIKDSIKNVTNHVKKTSLQATCKLNKEEKYEQE